jgi:hypothetical protein
MRWILAFVSAFAVLPCRANRDFVFMAGPMLHFKIGSRGQPSWSFGLEASYWNVRHLPVGADAGIEYDSRGLARLYAEGETGVGAAGAAFGPVAEIGRGFRLGVQGSVWANFFLGADYRVRKVWSVPLEQSAGAYLKIPAYIPAREPDY